MDNQNQDRVQTENNRETSLAVGLTVFVLLIAGLIFTFFSVRTWLFDEQKLPIQEIVFTGQLNAIDKLALEQQIRQEFQQSFVSVDVNQIHKLLVQEPWVYQVSIRKRWPSALLIHIVEQQPVATWNNDLLINKYGETFFGSAAHNALPSLYGPKGSEKTALVGYNHMRSLLVTSEQRISELHLSERFAWKLRLNNDIELNLGRQEYVDRLQRFIDYYPVIAAKQRPIDYIDLRYDTGLAVGWKSIASGKETGSADL